MRLTLLTDYALRLLMYVGQHPDRLCTVAEIVEAHTISDAHMRKVTHLLGLCGWIETVRGKGGGIRLAHEPAAIGLGDVVRSVEPDFALVECFTADSHCILTGRCRLAGVLGGGLQTFMTHLDGFSLADILPNAKSPELLIRPIKLVRRRAA